MSTIHRLCRNASGCSSNRGDGFDQNFTKNNMYTKINNVYIYLKY